MPRHLETMVANQFFETPDQLRIYFFEETISWTVLWNVKFHRISAYTTGYVIFLSLIFLFSLKNTWLKKYKIFNKKFLQMIKNRIRKWAILKPCQNRWQLPTPKETKDFKNKNNPFLYGCITRKKYTDLCSKQIVIVQKKSYVYHIT